MLGKAIALAVDVHTGQKREGGNPYILHPLRVMMQMETTEEMIVAVLHDVIEDGDETVVDRLKEIFSQEIVEAIDCMSRREGECYEDYIARVMSNELARKVKISDIEDNINVLELPVLKERHLKRLQKYHKIWGKLKGTVRV